MTSVDLRGKTFVRLKVKAYAGDGKWLCKCSCGNETSVLTRSLTRGLTKSCGCLLAETRKTATRTHGESGTRLYKVWCSMKNRCYCESNSNYQKYGGRGITVCDEWLEYVPFRDWALENGYDSEASYGECTIDRIDNDGNYCPENCRWVNMSVQATNKRTTLGKKIDPIKHPNARRTPIELIDDDGNVVERFESIREASDITGCRYRSIIRVCQGERKSTAGKRWRYAES